MCFIKKYKKKYFSIIFLYLLVNTCFGSNLDLKEKIVYKKDSLEKTVKIIDFSNDIKYKHIVFGKLTPNNFTKKINYNMSQSFLKSQSVIKVLKRIYGDQPINFLILDHPRLPSTSGIQLLIFQNKNVFSGLKPT